MPAQTASAETDAPITTIAVVNVLGDHRCADDGPRQVAAQLQERGRPVVHWQAAVPDGGPGTWLRELVDRLRAQVLAPTATLRPSVVHLFGWQAAVAASAARESGGPALVAHLGDGPPVCGDSDLDGRRLERLVWAAARAADAVVLDSEWAMERALRAGVPRGRAVRGLPVASVTESRAPWTAPEPARRRRVLAVGGVGRAAGTDVLLQAVGRLADVDLVVAAPVGTRATDLRPARRWLHGECRRHGLAEGDVRLEPFGTDLLSSCDAVVDAGTTAGASGGVVAAMAHRRAVIASDLGPKAEAVVAGTTGELVAPGSDWRAWCGQIVRLLRDPFKLEAYGDAGLERSRVGFAPARRADVIDHLDGQLCRPLAEVS